MKTVVRHAPAASLRDRLVRARGSLSNLSSIGRFGLRRPVALSRALRRYPWLYSLLHANELHDRYTRGRVGLYREATSMALRNVVAAILEMVGGFLERPDETVLHEDLVPPEILFGMGLNPWMVELLGIVVPMVVPDGMERYIDAAESAGIPGDVCSLPKSTMGLCLEGHLPPAAAVVTSNMPCDGGMSQYTILERELGAPTFRLDVPYNFYDEHAVDYFTGELRRLVTFLEEHTPGRMDWDRMRHVCEVRNRTLELELELWDLLRAKPAPLCAEAVTLTHLVWGIAQSGRESGVKVFEQLVETAHRNLERGALPEERHRMALWNPPTLIFTDLSPWIEQQWGVALLMDMLTFHRHPFIDTSTPDTMMRGLAQVVMQGPMARHTRGPAENFFGDLLWMVDHFSLDMLWMAGHIGCKNTQALLGIFREKCRERGVPLLIIDYDLSDTRIVSPAGIRTQVDRFMETVMHAERLAPKEEQ